ncbi:MAG: hypothetical protein EZS28_039852 [Streblomastix strix]|uniref:Right handed beta helix domain-containing protein n=1 Tax=Streblomastix strix TaxID=222440 RepID=A0A5J4U3N7_9EUKA|nr:MAG: hypothetical protein EZS28_039852 [Streblomastix strix]
MLRTVLILIALVICELKSESSSSFAHKTETVLPVNEAIEQKIGNEIGNEACKWKVSQLGSGDYTSIIEALDEPCSLTDGYEILLLDSTHCENLEVNQNSSIIIKGNNDKPTTWGLIFPYEEIILLKQGFLTLNSIEFDFSYQKGSTEIILPSRYLICTEGVEFHPTLTIMKCIFKSVSGITANNMFQIQIDFASQMNIYDSNFTGTGTDQPSNISLILISNCSETNIKNCIFSNASFISVSSAVLLLADKDNGSFVVSDCQFLNIVSNGEQTTSALSLLGFASFNSEISYNNFTNCTAINSSVGALCNFPRI